MSESSVRVAVADPALARHVARLASMAGLSAVTVAAEHLGAHVGVAAPLVIDLPAARELAGPPRGPVLVVSSAEPSAQDWRAVLPVGAERLLVLPEDEPVALEWLHRASSMRACWVGTDAGRRRSGRLLCCVAGRGGAGASVLAAALALAAARRDGRALLLDLDTDGGGQELLLGIEHVDGCRWPAVLDAGGAVNIAAMTAAAPSVGGVSVITRDAREPATLPGEVVRAVTTAAVATQDLVVADVAPAPASGATALPLADTALVVTTADVRGVASAVRVVSSVREVCNDVRLVVRRSGRVLRPEVIAEAARAPVVAEWQWERRLADAVDAGAFAVRWRGLAVARVAQHVLDVCAAPA